MIKRGYLTHYNECLFECFSEWKICYAILYNDSSFEIYLDGKDSQFSHRIKLNKVFRYIAVGKICSRVPNRPELPYDVPIDLMMGIPHVNSRNPDEMEYFYFSDLEEMFTWMRAIDSTLPHTAETTFNGIPVPNNSQNINNVPENQTTNQNPPQYTPNTTYYVTDGGLTHPYAYSSGLGMGLGLGFGVAMTMPLWATTSIWCQPTVVDISAPIMTMDGCNTMTIANDVAVPVAGNFGNDTIITSTTTEFNTNFGTTFTNDFGTGFGF